MGSMKKGNKDDEALRLKLMRAGDHLPRPSNFIMSDGDRCIPN